MGSAVADTVVNLGSIEKIPLGQGRPFIVNGQAIAVFRQRDSRVFATQNSCPHRGGPLSDGIVGAGRVICPLHAQKYNLQSGEGPDAHHCLTTYSTEIVAGSIIIRMPEKESVAAASCAAS
jgi:nitrite reductase (NADH) small subunit